MKKFVTCEICEREMKIINNDHLRTHSVTKQEYIRKYGAANLVSEETSYKLGVMRGKKRSEHSERMSGKNNPMYGGHTKETIKKISKNRKNKGLGVSGKYERTPEIKARISKAVAIQHSKGVFNHHHKGGYYLSMKTNRRYYYRSSWEKEVMEYLDRNDIVSDWIYEPFIVPYFDEYGQKRHYTPDFLVTISDFLKELWEVKPSFKIDDRMRCKLHSLEIYAKEHKIQVVRFFNENDLEVIKNNSEWVKQQYGS